MSRYFDHKPIAVSVCPIGDETCRMCICTATCIPWPPGVECDCYGTGCSAHGSCEDHGNERGNCRDCAMETWEDGIDLEAKEVGRAD